MESSPAVVALAVILLEGVVQGAAVAGRDLGRLGSARAAEVEGVGEYAQEPDQAVQLAHAILRTAHDVGQEGSLCREVPPGHQKGDLPSSDCVNNLRQRLR